MVYTSIRREASPLLRMRSHDLMQVFTDPCRCGRTACGSVILGRSDDMFIVKGVNVFPLGDPGVADGLAPQLTGEFRSSRPTTADRLSGPGHGGGRGRRPEERRAGARPRGRGRAAARRQLHGGCHARRAGHDRQGGQDATRDPQLSRGGRIMAVVEVEERGDVAVDHAGPPGQAERDQRRDAG